MGFAITWCAVREHSAEAFLKRLGLSPTGETEEMPDSPISTARLDTGWRVLWVNDYACPFLMPDRMFELTRDLEVLVCRVEEHVMACSSELWAGGEQRWGISHQGEDGPTGLDVEGTPPEGFAAIRSEMEEAQRAEGGDAANVDMIFEIPLKVAETLVGFKHDEDWSHVIGSRFEVLSRPEAPKKGLFEKLLGR